MTFAEIHARLFVSGGAHVERLVAHRRLPLLAGLDSQRPAVHVWDCASVPPRQLAVIGADAEPYDPRPWDLWSQVPSLTWHPAEPRLVLTGRPGPLRVWTPDGLTSLEATPANAAYRDVAFSPDGRTLWAYPSSGTGPDTWEFADAVDVESGALETMPRWDTGVVEHPGGGLVLTWRSDQAATLGVFARVDADAVPARLHALRRALLLGVDGYQAPVFSPDGRLFAVRGNAYEQTLDVFEFPSLRSVLCTTLNSPNPKKNVFPPQQEWLEELRSWSDHNVAFAPRSPFSWARRPGRSSGSISTRSA